MASNPLPGGPARAIAALHRIEDGILALLLGAMIVLAPLQIVLRGVLGTGIAWVDPLLRVLVLWLGLLGAVAASREGRHISIDVISRMLSARARAAAGAATSLFVAVVAGLVAYHGARFVVSERRFEIVAFSEIPAWWLESVIPFAFAAIAVRYLWLAAADLRGVFRSEAGDDGRSPQTGAP